MILRKITGKKFLHCFIILIKDKGPLNPCAQDFISKKILHHFTLFLIINSALPL